jgi:DNA-binding beta-propeller fold protein YncE
MIARHIRTSGRWVIAAVVLGSLLSPGALLAQTVTATIPVPAVDVAVNPVTNTIYALSNANTVAVIDGATNNVSATIELASGVADTSAVNPITGDQRGC